MVASFGHEVSEREAVGYSSSRQAHKGNPDQASVFGVRVLGFRTSVGR